jgi:nucleoid-associated protein YgaU
MATPTPTRRRILSALAVLAVLALGLIIGSAINGGTAPTQQATAGADTSGSAPLPSAEAAPGTDDDHRFDKVNEAIAEVNAKIRAAERAERAAGQATEGSYLVGSDLPADLPAGTYKANPSGNCYWARVRGTSDEGDIIANHYASGPTTVTIAPTDGMFVNRGCGTWTRVS